MENSVQQTSNESAVELMLRLSPLIKFSIATQIQYDALCRMQDRITNILDNELILKEEPLHIDATAQREAWGFFWLWVLGAYELVRTMHQAKECFDGDVAQMLSMCKGILTDIRIPFAKQERVRKKNVPALTEFMPLCKYYGERDMKFSIEGKDISIKETMKVFRLHISSITSDKIVRHYADMKIAVPSI